MKKSGKFAMGAAVAAAAGYVTGILTAPKSGKETRKDIKNNAAKVARETEKKLKLLHTELNSLITQGNTVVRTKTAKIKNDLEAALEKARISQQKVRELISAVRNGETDNKELEKAIKEANAAIAHLKKFIDNK